MNPIAAILGTGAAEAPPSAPGRARAEAAPGFSPLLERALRHGSPSAGPSAGTHRIEGDDTASMNAAHPTTERAKQPAGANGVAHASQRAVAAHAAHDDNASDVAKTARSGIGGPLSRTSDAEGDTSAATDEAGSTIEAASTIDAGDDASVTPRGVTAVAESRAATSAASKVVRSPEALEPEFRSKLDRVLQRMEDELGYTVRVTETFRSQARQDHLFAQGRTVPGPTVTWTRSSNHTKGLAADVAIEGGDDAAYAKLAKLAAEEGLRTLGPKDPGHVELRAAGGAESRAGTTPIRMATGLVARTAAPATPAAVATVARVAQVAVPGTAVPTARPAAVAQTEARATAGLAVGAGSGRPSAATVAQAAGSANAAAMEAAATNGAVVQAGATANTPRVGGPIRPVHPRALRDAAATGNTGTAGDEGGVAFATGTRGTGRKPDPRMVRAAQSSPERDAGSGWGSGAQAGSAYSTDADPLADLRATAPANTAHVTTGLSNAAEAVAGAGGPDIAGRVARLLALQDAVRSAPPTGVTLEVGPEDGLAAAKIRLGVRGNAIDALIEMADPVAASRLSGRVDELRRALERTGLEPASLLVREGPSTGVTGGRGTSAGQNHDTDPETGRQGWMRRDPGNPDGRKNGRRNSKENER